MFKVGDRVRFIDSDNIGWQGSRNGKIYTVTDVDGDIVYVDALDIYRGRAGAFDSRFELVIESQEDLLKEMASAAHRLRELGAVVECNVTFTTTTKEVI